MDARARFDRGWDEVLLRELELAERYSTRSRWCEEVQEDQDATAAAAPAGDGHRAMAGAAGAASGGAVLTGYPLGYRMRNAPVMDDEVGHAVQVEFSLPIA